ncbi:MAG: nucleotide exchange factor GrpE [bacterium]
MIKKENKEKNSKQNENDNPNNETESNNIFAQGIEPNNNEKIEQQLEENNQLKLETLKNQYLRLAADFDNYRKRHAQERECLLKYGAEDTLKKLLPILDTFERAQKSISEMDDPVKIKESFEVLQKQFLEALEKIGLQKIETVGKEFDPMYHEAVMQTSTDEYQDHTIIAELQSGYKLHDRVVRPALVNVAVN